MKGKAGHEAKESPKVEKMERKMGHEMKRGKDYKMGKRGGSRSHGR